MDEVILEAANDGVGELQVTVEGSAPWLTVALPEKPEEEKPRSFLRQTVAPRAENGFTVKELEEIRLVCDRDALPDGEAQVTLVIRSTGEGSHAACTVHVDVRARRHAANPEPAFMPVKGVVTMEAHHFVAQHDTAEAGFRILPGYGRSGHAVKVYPSTAAFAPGADAPSLTYRFLAERAGSYVCELWLTPTSPLRPGTPMRCTITGPDGAMDVLTCVPADYRPGENSDPRWCAAMVDHIRKVRCSVVCREGLNEITIGAIDPNFSLERLVIHPADQRLQASYLGPTESAVE